MEGLLDEVKISEILFYEKVAFLRKQPDQFCFYYIINMYFKGLFISLNWFIEKCKK